MLTANNISFSYNNNPFIDGISFDVKAGEIVGVIGPNGSGKTTLIRLLSGILPLSGGIISLNGISIDDLEPRERARLVSVVPQNANLPNGLTVLDLVLLARNPHLSIFELESRTDIEIALSAIQDAGIEPLFDRYVDSLSGGEKQRAVIAMALAQQSPILLLDEPTSNLDLAHQPAIMDTIVKTMESKSAAVLLTMHDLTLAAQYCTRLIMLNNGRVYTQGIPSAVLSAKNIEEVYGASVDILIHPNKGTPVILPKSTCISS